MRRTWIAMILLGFTSSLCLGQEVNEDPDVRTNTFPDSVVRKAAVLSGVEPLPLDMEISNGFFTTADSLTSIEFSGHFNSTINPKSFDQPGTAFIPLWSNGGFLATGERTVLPGLMQIDSGSIGLMQNLGSFSLYLGGVANKYGYYNGLHTQYGMNGSVSYSFSPKLSMVGFGTYYFGKPPLMPNGMPMPPSLVGYYGVSSFGGYVDYQINETFGMQVGGQAVQQFGTDKYRFEPIVTPTVKVGKVRIGLPVGQILHGIIRTQAEGRRGR